MTHYGWTNEEGEPIMDGAAYRFEQQLDMDSQADYYADHFYDNEGEPEECEDEEHDCVDCEGQPDGTGWHCSWCDRPCPEDAHDDTGWGQDEPEDAWLDDVGE